jgi:hypothetical protein
MFRSKPQIVVKQHLYTADEHRIRIKEYNKYKTESVELVNTKQKLYQAINTSVWKKKNEDKDGLIILSKETDNIKNCVNDIKNLQTILASCF